MTSNKPALRSITITMIEPRYTIALFQSSESFLLYQRLHLLLMVNTIFFFFFFLLMVTIKLYPTISKNKFPTVNRIKVRIKV